jgi:prophage antirepressor-like protein
MNNNLTTFEGKDLRKIWHNDEWYYSIVDVIEVLTESIAPSKYWDAVKRREPQLSTICRKLKFLAPDGKMRPTDCANTEGVFRIIMSVPSPKVEPLKLWLAEQGKRTIDETNDPELMTERQAEIYRAKGYPEEWIVRRLQTIEIRKQLTDEWKNRGVQEGMEYSILTATIAKGTFGLTPSEHAELKSLKKTDNLRDHMTPLELVLVALGEEVTRAITVKENAVGFNENLDAATKGGELGGEALAAVERKTGDKVLSANNFKFNMGDKVIKE